MYTALYKTNKKIKHMLTVSYEYVANCLRCRYGFDILTMEDELVGSVEN